jgi:hypothetical protein
MCLLRAPEEYIAGAALDRAGLEQRSSTWVTRVPNGSRRHLRGYAKRCYGLRKIREKISRNKHRIIRAKCSVSYRGPGRKDIQFGSAIPPPFL